MEKTNISIIIPAYNESLTIAQTIEAFSKALPEAKIVVVNNNSTDDTASLALESIKKARCNGVVLNESRQGKGFALRKAFSEVEADCYIMVDGDMTYSALDVHKLMEPVLNGEQDMVVGDRHSSGSYKAQNRRMFHNFGNNLVTNLINTLFGSCLVDIISGYRVFSRKFIRHFPIMCSGFEIETEMTLHALDKRFRILEIPVSYVDRPEGSNSKLNTYKDGLRILKTIVWVFKDYNPLLFFGSLALLSFFSGVVVGIPVFSEYLSYKYIYRVPSAILATGLMIVSLLFFAIGLILDTVVKYQRFNYELQLIRDAGLHGKSD